MKFLLEPGVVRNLEVISDGPRNATVTWLAPKPITGNLSYTVSAEGADGPMVVSRFELTWL